jgi:hypothetical protein
MSDGDLGPCCVNAPTALEHPLDPRSSRKLIAYLELLWNEPEDQPHGDFARLRMAIDRLLLEPLAAPAPSSRAERWPILDLAAAPRFPRLALGALGSNLLMVESRSRRLVPREAAGLVDSPRGLAIRFEEWIHQGAYPWARRGSMRAVRARRDTLGTGTWLTRPGGIGADYFGSRATRFERRGQVFHVEHHSLLLCW